MAWDPALNGLQNALADLYPDEADARRVSASAGLNTALVDFGGSALDRWHNILDEGARQSRVDDLITLAQGEYRVNTALARAVEAYRARPVRQSTEEAVRPLWNRFPLPVVLIGLIVVGLLVVVVITRVLDRGAGGPKGEPTGTPTDAPTATATAAPPTATATPARPTPFPTVVYTSFFVSDPSDPFSFFPVKTEYRVQPGILPSETITDFLKLSSMEWGELAGEQDDGMVFSFTFKLKNTGTTPLALDLDERFYSLEDLQGRTGELLYYCCAAREDWLAPGQERDIFLIFRAYPGWLGKGGGASTARLRVQGLRPVLRAEWEIPLPKTAD